MELNMSVLILLFLSGFTTACFITNCPPGGKRSLSLSENTHKQCTRCGPAGLGRCFGPDICCGQSIGCHFRNKISSVCRTEDYSPRPCKNEGRSCDNGKGVCAMDSICCTSNGCYTDRICELDHIKSPIEDTVDTKWSNSIEGNIL